ncbi:PTS lactose/cellobiose transporter subunit IIA [Floccifex sp.]|uniref:PTS lactose/cellobiose transporter subunit IIA n=1 Tax=Floccifex sp. TaxID=2815810 RepID=UPI002A757732|nr:PTS lactose/cellobiose transporter subunit IIA [Floccifex sp.]MDY2957708.1 PTS lactose/cellobiose transporter subunit IIA [Floccifex sp.]
MNEEFEMICFQIISNSGMAKSCYVDAIQKAKEKDYEGASKLMEDAENYFVDAHKVHAELIQKEAGGQKTEFSLLLLHAEDQMASAEMAKLLAEEMIELYKKLDA